MARRTHSTIDTLPADLRDTLTRMVVDGQWPPDYDTDRAGKPRYEDLAAYCLQQGYTISESAIGRWAQPLLVLSMMKQKGTIVRNVMATLGDQTASETQKAAVELITAQAIEVILAQDTLTPKQISELAKTFKDCAYVSITADKYIHEQISAKAKAADQQITAIADKKKIDPETLKIIREQVYGIVS